MKIYFDFDGTIYNTTKYYNDYLDIFEKLGISKDEVEKVQKSMFDNNFSKDRLTKCLVETYNLDNSIFEIVENLFKSNYVYDDCEDFINRISDYYEVAMLTRGDREYQLQKLENCGLAKYFKDIIITEGDKYLADIDFGNGIFIDNNPIELDRFKSVGAKYLYRIRRDGDSHCNDVGDYESIKKFDDDFFETLLKIKNEIE